jgi:hypothetical protein
MTMREDFEAWLESQYVGGCLTVSEKETVWSSWQAATSRQEAKIKVLTDALESLVIQATPPEHEIEDASNEYLEQYFPAWFRGRAALAAAKETT